MNSFSNPIVQAGVAGLRDLFLDRAVTPLEATEAYLSRIEGLDGALGAFNDLDAARAREDAHASAERWRAGAALSPLDGAPIAVKANIAVAGLPWTAGIGAHRDRRATEDAACVAKLREAGAVILGTLNMHEGAFGAMTDNPWFGRTHNPWRHGTSAGGSSGGSAAAVAAGLCAGALGSDTLGSVRIPSALCGVYGHKPTQGLISTDGVVAMSWTLDHVGVHGRCADDCARLLAGACGAEAELAEEIAEPADLAALRGAPLAALDLASGPPVEPAVAEAYARVLAAARAQGLQIETVRLDGYDWAQALRLGVLISGAESAVEHKAAMEADVEGFSTALRERIAFGAGQTAAELAACYRDLHRLADAARDTLGAYAGLLLPTTPGPAFSFDDGQPGGVALFTTLANALGLPATAFPAGLAGELPLSVQALAWDDETSLGLAKLLGQDLGPPPAYRG